MNITIFYKKKISLIKWSKIFIFALISTHALQGYAMTNVPAKPLPPIPKAPAMIAPGQWSAGIKEAGSKYSCAGNGILIGRDHQGDENGSTKYKCGLATQFGQAIVVSEKKNRRTSKNHLARSTPVLKIPS